MRLGKVSLAAATALSVASAPVLAQASNPAPVRAAAEMEDANELGRGGWIIPLLALGAIILGILVIIKDDDDDRVSP